VAEAREHSQRHVYEPDRIAQQAVTYARDHLFERSAVLDRRDLLEAALNRGMGETTYARVRQEFAQRAARGEFRPVDHAGAGQQYTTAAMVRMEREIVARMQEGNRRGVNDPMLVSPQVRIAMQDRHPELNASQRQTVEQIFLSREKMVGLDAIAGAGTTTTLAVIREGAEAQGYKVEGFAHTSRAAQKLADAGMETSTLQKHLARWQQPDTGVCHLYVLDESSLTSTKQMHEFLNRLHPNDRVLLVGDRRQHEAVEAGRPFAQLQDAGMKTVKLEEIIRQKDPELKQVVEQLARGEVREAVQGLERQGRIHEISGREERIAAMAKEYAKSPEGTLVVSPDNRSRVEINLAIHAEMHERGLVNRDEHRIEALVPRQDLTGPERTWAARYKFNDVVRYARASKENGIERGEYARVKSVDAEKNLLTVVRANGSELSYDPRRHQGVSVYREEPRNFAVGDRIQFTAPANDLKTANRELGTVEAIGQDGQMRLKMDGGRDVHLDLDPRQHPHLDHGYAVTSHSSQGQTAERVLIHVDTELAAKDLLNSRMAYVAVSRGAGDAQLYTNDREKVPEALGHDVSQESAHMPAMKPEQAITPPQLEIAPVIEHSHGMGRSL
jgi:ATP-dependent exoDNAse (exonuclease V) alpha subunit